MKTQKIAIVGSHGVGKTKICNRIKERLFREFFYKEEFKIRTGIKYSHYEYGAEIEYNFKNKFAFIQEQFREVVQNLHMLEKPTKQTEEITLATHGKQSYLENLCTAQEKNILCDRSVLDTFIYYVYFNGISTPEGRDWNFTTDLMFDYILTGYIKSYSKIYLIEPSDREIENDGFRLTDKKQQFEIHNLFLVYFKNFDNVEIVNQEEAHKEEFIERVSKEFVL